MATRGKKRPLRLQEAEDERESKAMFAEYREENAKDLAREGIGNVGPCASSPKNPRPPSRSRFNGTPRLHI
jgi:hypothetical protein